MAEMYQSQELPSGVDRGRIRPGRLVELEEVDEEHEIQLVGDDLTVTNKARIQTAIDKKACDCLLKVNQIGTVT